MIYIQTILSGAVAGPRRPANRPAHRHVPPDRQGLAVPERCRGRGDAVRLCPRFAPPDAGAARLGAADEHRREPPPADRQGETAAGPGDRAGELARSRTCRRRERSRSRPIRSSSPTRSASTPAARAPSRPLRVEIWAFGRRNPFLPWTGLDPWSIAALWPAQAGASLEIARPARARSGSGGSAGGPAATLGLRPGLARRRGRPRTPTFRRAGARRGPSCFCRARYRVLRSARPRADRARPSRPPGQSASRRPAVLAAPGDAFPRPVRRLARFHRRICSTGTGSPTDPASATAGPITSSPPRRRGPAGSP